MAAAAVEATDEHLVAAARAGSDTAFETLFRRYRDRIAAYVRGMCADHGRVEDIVQEVFISAHRHMLKSESPIAFKPWIYEIAKNACIDNARRARRTNEVSIDSDDFSAYDEGRLSAGVTGTDAAVSRRQELDSLTMAFNELPEQQHEILVLRELEGLSYDKISSRVGLSRSAVESTLFRARRRLKDEFDDISTGERCQRTQAAMAKLSNGRVGIREERRLSGHLRACAACRREAVAMGLDQLALGGVRGRARAALSRAASFLPLPGFLRRRWADGINALGTAGSSGAEQGASFAAKAVALVAAAALVGGGAGVVHKAVGDSSKRAGASGQGSETPGGGPAGRGGEAGQNGGSHGSGGSRESGGAGGKQGGSGGGAANGGAPGSKAGGGNGAVGQTLNDATAGAQGVGGKAGSLVDGVGGSGSGSGTLGSTVQGVTKGTGDTLNKVGGTAGDTVNSVTDGAGNTVQSVGGTVNGVTSPTLQQVQPTVDQVTSKLPQTSVTTPTVKVPSTKLGL